MNTIICLMGPTASGKTALAIELSQKIPCDIISVDSGMIYRDMNIGTAKPSPAELAIAPHRLIDIIDPSESYSAAQFCRDASQEISRILDAGRIPLLVGGTMLYFRALQQGLSAIPPADVEIRAQINFAAANSSWRELHAKLARVDPISAARISPNDAQRISRALEVYELTGSTLTQLHQQNKPEPFPYKMINLAIIPADRELLQNRIKQRFYSMLATGFIDEVEMLHKRGDLSSSLPAMRAVGYRQVWQYLSGELTYPEMEERAIIATRQLAKRQLTWLRSWPELNALTDGSIKSVLQILAY